MSWIEIERLKSFYHSPSLWNDRLCGLRQFRLSQLDLAAIDQHDQITLPEIPPRTVLGKRAEYLFQFCVEQSSNYDLIISNIQIFKDKVTIGELDYILRDRSRDQLIHVELVYKFYIYDPSVPRENGNTIIENELLRYQGPNRRDNLVKKMRRLKNHQLPLIYEPQTQAILQSLGITASDIEQQVCFIGHIFIPRAFWNHSFKYINKSCILGYYLDYSAFAKAETQNIYFLPKKVSWNLKPFALDASYSFHEVLIEIKNSLSRGFAPMVWMQLEDENFERFFVVHSSP